MRVAIRQPARPLPMRSIRPHHSHVPGHELVGFVWTRRSEMSARIFPIIVIAALAMSFGGCPAGSTTITQGLWLFTIVTSGVSSTTGALNLLPNGQTTIPNPTPPEASDDFGAAPFWSTSGSSVTFQFQGLTALYVGTIHSSTSMSGTVEDSGQTLGLWSAILLE